MCNIFFFKQLNNFNLGPYLEQLIIMMIKSWYENTVQKQWHCLLEIFRLSLIANTRYTSITRFEAWYRFIRIIETKSINKGSWLLKIHQRSFIPDSYPFLSGIKIHFIYKTYNILWLYFKYTVKYYLKL